MTLQSINLTIWPKFHFLQARPLITLDSSGELRSEKIQGEKNNIFWTFLQGNDCNKLNAISYEKESDLIIQNLWVSSFYPLHALHLPGWFLHRRSLARIICSQHRGQGTPTAKFYLSFCSLFPGNSWTAHLYPIGIQLEFNFQQPWDRLLQCQVFPSSDRDWMVHLWFAFLFLTYSGTSHAGDGVRMEAMAWKCGE